MLPAQSPILRCEDPVLAGATRAVLALIHAAQGGAGRGVEANFPEVVQNPGGDELNVGLGSFLLDEALQLVVAVAFRRHGPELADDGDLRLRRRAVDLDGAEDLLGPHQRRQNRLLVQERVATDVLGLRDGRIRGAGYLLVRAQAIADAVDHVAGNQALQEADEKRRVQLQTAGFTSRLAEAALLLKQHYAEAVETRVAQGLAVLRHVHAEAARAAGASREEHVVVDDLFRGEALLVAQMNQVLNQVADGEVRGVALLRLVAEFLAHAERVVVRRVERDGVVAERRERARDQVVVGDGQAADEQSDFPLFRLGEHQVRHVLDPLLLDGDAQARCALRL